MKKKTCPIFFDKGYKQILKKQFANTFRRVDLKKYHHYLLKKA